MKLFLSILLFGVMSAVHAEGPLTSEMETYLVSTNKNGQETLSPAEQASPGDIIEYRLIYTNEADQPLSGLVITGPIPANTEYLEKSARTEVPASFTVSIDDGNTFEQEPVTRTKAGDDGQPQNVTVSPSDYTQVRWQPKGSLQPDQVQEYRYRVKVQ
ncbi:MAG: hypothetical protein MI745_04695 [Pseudomonadales bacterium]|nr:hypothetical protein [Pseudomonadales bacterium]